MHPVPSNPAHAPARRWLPPTAWMALIFILSAVPGDRYPRIDLPDADKGMHAILFLPLGWLLGRAMPRRGSGPPLPFPDRQALIAIGIGALYGLSDEIHQLWVPHRSFSLLDLAVDILAIAAGAAAWHIASRLPARSHATAPFPALTHAPPGTKPTPTPEDHYAHHP